MTETRAVVTWNGPGQPVVLTVYGPDGEEVAMPMSPERALTLAQELLDCGVAAIKSETWDSVYKQGVPVERGGEKGIDPWLL